MLNEISICDLESVTGGKSALQRVGQFALGAGRFAGRVASRANPYLHVIQDGIAAYDGFQRGRAQGHGVLRSTGDAAQQVISSETGGLVPEVRDPRQH